MANLAYDKGKADLLAWLITQDVRALLLTTSYTPAVGDNFVSAISANELSVSGYSRKALTTMAVTQDDANTRAYFTADNLVWASLAAGQTIGWCVVYINTGADGTSKLYGAYQTTATPTNGGSFTLQFASGASVPGGVIQIS